jgi:hypothetical protein
MFYLRRFAVAAYASGAQTNSGRGPTPLWLDRNNYMRLGMLNAKAKPGTRISLVSAVIATLLAGSFATVIGLGLFHRSSERIQSYLGPFAVVMIFAHLVSLYIDERRSRLK